MKSERVVDQGGRPGVNRGPRSRAGAGLASLGTVLWLGIMLCAPAGQVAAQAPAKNVLVMLSFFDRNRASLDKIEASVRAHGPWPVNFSEEYLESSRLEEEPYRESLAETFRREYEGKKPDLLLVASEPALRFAVQYRDKMFPGVPIVFWAISSALADQKMPGVTGVKTAAGTRETVDLALRLQPDTTAVAVVAGTSDIEQYWLGDVHSELLRRQDRVKEVDVVGAPGASILEKVAALPPHTVILFLLFPEDSNQPVISNWDVLAAASRHLPTYSLFPTLALNRGGIGGAYYDDSKDSELAGEMGARVLRGERPDDIPVVHIPNLQVKVDWRELQRWHLPESALPPGSLVLYRQPSAWEMYEGYIIAGVSVICIEAVLIVALIWQSARRRRTEEELAITYDRLRMAIEAATSVGWDADFRTGRNRWFGDLKTMFGIPTGHHNVHIEGFRERVHPDDLATVDAALADAREQRAPYAAEFRVIRTDGEVRWIAARGKYYFSANGEPERMLGMAVDITDHKLAEEALNSLSGQLITAQEEERRRIAREIHDDYQQRLAVLAIDLDMLSQDAARGDFISGSQLREQFDRVNELNADLHSLSHRLHSSTLDSLGLVAALKVLCAEYGDHHKIEVALVATDVPESIPTEPALCLFRVAQEALQNVRKHSRARKAEVRVEGRDGNIHLSVSDDGTGFDPASASRHGGIGIRSMEERLRLVNGRLAVHSRPIMGTIIDAWVPILDHETDSQLRNADSLLSR